jgi:5-methylcytosine-specific restriction enzyme subunit McrC
MPLNPDLVFEGGMAIGDVKYKVAVADWGRSDLYQVVAFATGFQSDAACIVGFRESPAQQLPPPLQVGNVSVRYIAWSVDEGQSPAESGDALIAEVNAWLQYVAFRSGEGTAAA